MCSGPNPPPITVKIIRICPTWVFFLFQSQNWPHKITLHCKKTLGFVPILFCHSPIFFQLAEDILWWAGLAFCTKSEKLFRNPHHHSFSSVSASLQNPRLFWFWPSLAPNHFSKQPLLRLSLFYSSHSLIFVFLSNQTKHPMNSYNHSWIVFSKFVSRHICAVIFLSPATPLKLHETAHPILLNSFRGQFFFGKCILSPNLHQLEYWFPMLNLST